jgi:hypothetical protein
MRDYLIAMTAIPALLLGWLLVQRLSRMFSRANPQLGPHREEGAGCGSSCMCSSGGSCKRSDHPAAGDE